MTYIVLDVQYSDESSNVACVVFDDHRSNEVIRIASIFCDEKPEEYIPGNFAKRELPLLKRMIDSVVDDFNDVTFIIDGYVRFSDAKPCLGQRLYDSYDGKYPVIGVAKTRFQDATSIEVLRGGSKNPLFITSVGVDADAAAQIIKEMHGAYRIPTLLKACDSEARKAYSK